jgi:hypothetical protein
MNRAKIRIHVSELDAQIIALQSALDTALLERHQLQEQLDAVPYPILTLLLEITSEIFISSLPDYPERPPLSGPTSPTALAHVCRKSRAIPLATPALWRVMQAKLCGVSLSNTLHLLQTWLIRSQNFPLLISLAAAEPRSLVLQWTDLVEAILRHSSRWENVELFLPLADLYLIRGGDFPILREISFGPRGEEPYDLPETPLAWFTNAPKLRHVGLAGMPDISDFELPWS